MLGLQLAFLTLGIVHGVVAASVVSAQTLPSTSSLLQSTPRPNVVEIRNVAAAGPLHTGQVSMPGGTRTLPNVSPQQDWPSPVNDEEPHVFTLVDVLEYRPQTGAQQSASDYRWDIEGWYGGDYNRVWFKSEGQRDTAFKPDYDIDFQLLYGRFIQKYYDVQIGPRVETQTFRRQNVTRGLAVIGIQGLVPYNYEIETALFIDQNGAVSARLSLTKDLLLTQRLILQTRFETNAAIQRVERFTTGSGLNNLEFGMRLRYEIRREMAPYVGISLDRSFGETATLVRQDGGTPSQIRLVVGLRMWF